MRFTCEFEFPSGPALQDACLRLLQQAQEQWSAASADPERAVHQLRVNGKCLRAWLKLARHDLPGDRLGALIEMVRDTNKLLSGHRDLAVLRELAGRLGGHAGDITGSADESLSDELRQEVSTKLREIHLALPRCDFWEVTPSGAGKAFRKNLRQVVGNLRLCHTSTDPETLHHLRKRVKEAYFQNELNLKNGEHFAELARKLGSQLGEANDLAVLLARLDDDASAESPAKLQTKAAKHLREVRGQCLELAGKLVDSIKTL